MKIFQAFVVILAAIILFLMPLTTLVYDFRTDEKEDSFTVITAVGNTTPLVVLHEPVYEDDTSTISALSNLSTDVPLFVSYNTTSRATVFSGMTANATRTLQVFYRVDALMPDVALMTFVDKIAWIFMLVAICFPLAALAAIFTGRA